MSRTRIIALALAATAFTAGGCGGSSKATSTASGGTTATATQTTTAAASQTTTTAVKLASGKPLTRAQWIAKGDAICARLNTQLSATVVKSPSDLERVLPQATLYERSALAQLSSLVPPSRYRSPWLHLLSNVEHWAANSAAMAAETHSGHFKINTRLFETTDAYHENFASIARHSGFKVCSVA